MRMREGGVWLLGGRWKSGLFGGFGGFYGDFEGFSAGEEGAEWELAGRMFCVVNGEKCG